MRLRNVCLFLSALFLVGLCSCTPTQKYYQLDGMLHTTYQIKYEYSQPLDREIQEALQRYILPKTSGL